MSYTITLLPFEKQFTCEENEIILQAGLRQGFNLRYGCKHGGCGSCKALITDGEVDQEEASSFALMDFERAQGYTLLCSSYPVEDITIELSDYDEDELLAASLIQEYQAEVEQVTALTHDIRGIHLRLIEPGVLTFKAGQYVDVLVPGTTEWRSYSMANPPSRCQEIEIMVKLMPGGLFSSYIEEHLQVGDRRQVCDQGGYRRLSAVLPATGYETTRVSGELVQAQRQETGTRPGDPQWRSVCSAERRICTTHSSCATKRTYSGLPSTVPNG
ncbi:MAG: 2Fe-2S iron-sulfur cluster-binding protein [Candidatus Binatia bacterium]